MNLKLAKTLGLCAVLAFSALGVRAETMFVGDTLRIGVRTDTSNDAAAITVITTGATVDVLQRQGNLSRVRTEQGVEGWVKSAYLANEKPAALLLREANAKIRKLESEISKVGATDGTIGSGDASRLGALESEKADLEQELSKLRKEIGNENDRQSLIEGSSTSANSWYWLIGSLVVILSLGFLFGVTWHRHQVMKRLGGLRL